MGFFELLEVASMPVLEVLIISFIGAILATDYFNFLHADARSYMNKVVFVAFTPALMFASLAKTVTLQDIISWWFMPVNTGLTFLFGGILGWIAVKVLKPKPYLEGLVIATCSSGNLGNLMLIIVPAICKEKNSPFGNRDSCATVGLSYASFSMALGGFYIWTYSYHLIQSSAKRYKALKEDEEISKQPNKDLDANEKSHLLEGASQEQVAIVVSTPKSTEEGKENKAIVVSQLMKEEQASFWVKLARFFCKIVKELMAPPTLGAIVGFIFGTIPWLRHLIIGDSAPLRVVQGSIKLLGDGQIPCITIIQGGNLLQGLRQRKLSPSLIIAVVAVRNIILPVIGIGVVFAAAKLGLLPSDPLFRFVLMVQFTMPPAMNIGTMTQLYDVAQEECSVIILWTYLAAALSLTVWSTVFMWILS